MNHNNKHLTALTLSLVLIATLTPSCSPGGTGDLPPTAIVTETATPTPITPEPTPIPTPGPSEFGFDAESYSLELELYEISKNEASINGETAGTWVSSDFMFDNFGRLVSEKSDKSYTTFYEYDDIGRLIRENVAYDFADPHVVAYFYGDSGELISSVSQYNIENFIETTYSYEYDSHNRVIKLVEASSDGEYREIAYTYNNKGDIANRIYTKPRSDETYLEQFDCKYDKFGRIIEITNTKNAFRRKFEYIIAGYLGISPETNPELLTPDKWVSIEGAYGLPSPDSCVSTIVPSGGADGLVFAVTPIGAEWIEKPLAHEHAHIQDREKREYRKYQLILSELCGFGLEVSDDGAITILKNGIAVSNMDYLYDEVYGFCIVLNLAD